MKKNEQSHGLLGIQNTVEVRHALPCRVVLWFPVSHTYCLIRQKNVSSVIATPFCSTSVSLHVQRTHLTKRAKSYGGGIRCSSFHYKHRVFASLPRRGGSVLQGTARRLSLLPVCFEEVSLLKIVTEGVCSLITRVILTGCAIHRTCCTGCVILSHDLTCFGLIVRSSTLQGSAQVNLALFARQISRRVSAVRKRASDSDAAGTRPGGGGVLACPR